MFDEHDSFYRLRIRLGVLIQDGEKMDRALRDNLRRLGFRAAEIEAIDKQTRENARAKPGRKPKAPTAVTEAMRRYNARKRAERTGEPIPVWARKRA